MAKRGPTDLVHWMGGYDLAGAGAITEVTQTVEAMAQEVTPLGPMGAIEHETPIGRVAYSLMEKGYLGDRQSSLRQLISDEAAGYPWPSILSYEGGAIGTRCFLSTDMRIRKSMTMPDLDGISYVEIEYLLNQGGNLYEDALILASGKASGVTNGPSPAADYRVTNADGATTAGAVICVMVDPDKTMFRGYNRLNLDIRQFNGTSWTNVGSQIVLRRPDNPIKSIVTVPSGTTLEGVVALQWGFAGARDSFRLVGNHQNGATSISLDTPSAGASRVEEGDMLSISGTNYTVASATSPSTGAWTVVLTSGLGSNVADNTSITLTGTNTELRYAAAIHRS